MAVPAVQSLEEIYAQLNPAYTGTRNIVNTQLSAIPGQYQASTDALGVKKDNAFRQVNTNANAKGMAFSGIPAAEQTRYLGETYLPAVAGLEAQKGTATLELQKILADIEKEQRLRAMDTRTDQQKALDAYIENERERAFKLQVQREAAAAEARSGGGGGGSQASGPPTPQQRKDKGFNFQDPTGRAISARTYASLTNTPFSALLKQMAAAGDAGAADVLKRGSSSKHYKNVVWG